MLTILEPWVRTPSSTSLLFYLRQEILILLGQQKQQKENKEVDLEGMSGRLRVGVAGLAAA